MLKIADFLTAGFEIMQLCELFADFIFADGDGNTINNAC